MDDTDRLSRYLDGALEPDEQQALEAALAGDAVLRAELARMRAIDEELATIAATELPPGARERLDTRLEPVLRAALDADTPRVAAAAPTTAEALGRRDALAGRRARRRLPVAIGGVAAGLAVLAVGVLGVERLLPQRGGDDSAASLALDAMDEAADDGEETAGSAPEAAPDARSLLPELPVVLADERQVTTEDLDLALAAAPLQQITAAALGDVEATALAEAAQARLGVGATSDADVAASQDTEREVQAPALTTADGREIPPPDLEVIQRCVAELLEAGTAAIPVLIELLEVDRVPALQIGLATLDPDAGTYTRAEVWTLERASCQVLRFAQS
ncbi:MAG: anti-sigma factor family protein [Nitriliruptoraceae bacterium]